MVRISGFDKLARQMDHLARFGEEVDGQITSVSFDPTDPASIEIAISKMEAAIDEKALPYEGNSMVANLVEQMKEDFRAQILERATAARLERKAE